MCVQDNGMKPLRCLDVFAGCGGLSLGLDQSGATESKWAIEFEPRAAEAFKLNFPDVAISTDDCNIILKVSFTISRIDYDGMVRVVVSLLCWLPEFLWCAAALITSPSWRARPRIARALHFLKKERSRYYVVDLHAKDTVA